MYIANVFDVVYSTTLLKMKTKTSKSENQERKKRKTKYPNFKSKNWKTISIWISFKTTHLAHSRPIMVDSFSYRYTFTARTCLVPRRLSFDENVRAKEGGKEKTVCTLPMVPCSSWPVTRVSHSPLPCEKRSAWGGGCARTIIIWLQRKYLDCLSHFSLCFWFHLALKTD